MKTQALTIYSSIVLSQTLSIGPAVAMLLKNYLDRGMKSSIKLSLSFKLGEAVVIFTSFLITSMLNISNYLFNFLGIVGGAYLMYLGISSLMAYSKAKSKKDVFVLKPSQAIMIPITNPKALLFFMMFIPSYINNNINEGVYWVSYLYLGIIFIAISFLTDIFYLLTSKFLSGIIGSRFENVINIISPLFLIITGGVFILKAFQIF